MKIRLARTWHQIVKQEGISGVIMGESPTVEFEHSRLLRQGKVKRVGNKYVRIKKANSNKKYGLFNTNKLSAKVI